MKRRKRKGERIKKEIKGKERKRSQKGGLPVATVY